MPAGVPTPTVNDIAMQQSTGQLYTLDSNGKYDQLNISVAGGGAFLSSTSDGITSYQLDPATNTVVNQPLANVVFTAMAYGPGNTLYAVGSRPAGDDVTYTTNLLYEFTVNGATLTPVSYPGDSGVRRGWGPTSRRWLP